MAAHTAHAPVGSDRPALTSRARQLRNRRALTYLALSVAFVATVLPFAWMLLGSFKTQGELLQRPLTWWPQRPTLENYSTWLNDLGYAQFFANSLFVALVVVVGNLLFCSMVAYALAKLTFPGKRILFALVLLMLMVPGIVTLIPMFVLVSNLGLVNTYWGLILPFLVTPFGVFLMRQFLVDIPDQLLEAARIDGAGEFRIFFRVVLPLCKPALAALGILTFLTSWNNFLWPLIVAQDTRVYTLPVALALYSVGENGVFYGILTAGSVLVIAPILILFLFLQRFFVQGIATSGLK